MGLGDRDKQTRVAVEKQLLRIERNLTHCRNFTDNNKVVERTRKIEQMQGYLAQFDLIGSPRSLAEMMHN